MSTNEMNGHIHIHTHARKTLIFIRVRANKLGRIYPANCNFIEVGYLHRLVMLCKLSVSHKRSHKSCAQVRTETMLYTIYHCVFLQIMCVVHPWFKSHKTACISYVFVWHLYTAKIKLISSCHQSITLRSKKSVIKELKLLVRRSQGRNA